MREPYETLLGPYRSHHLLWRFLEGDIPKFAELASADLRSLSTSETILVNVAFALWNWDNEASVTDLFRLDFETRTRVLTALCLASEMAPR